MLVSRVSDRQLQVCLSKDELLEAVTQYVRAKNIPDLAGTEIGFGYNVHTPDGITLRARVSAGVEGSRE